MIEDVLTRIEALEEVVFPPTKKNINSEKGE
jgi:hypothetical protein